MKNKYNDFAYAITNYLSKYLPTEAGVSINTILSYRDTLKLFIMFASEVMHIKPNNLTIEAFNEKTVIEFLDWIEISRNCSISTRNIRLAAMHAFAKYIGYQYPEFIKYANEVISINKKRTSVSTEGLLASTLHYF